MRPWFCGLSTERLVLLGVTLVVDNDDCDYDDDDEMTVKMMMSRWK